MTRFPRFSDPLIEDAFRELERIEDVSTRTGSLADILRVLVHGEPELVRVHLATIEDAWMRFQLLIDLYRAHGNERDLNQACRIIPDDSFPDAEELEGQINSLRAEVAQGERSKPEDCIVTSQYREYMLARSGGRLLEFLDKGYAPIFIFNELCIRISYGDASLIGKARDIAGEDLELRDRIVLAVAAAHAHNASPPRAKKALQHVVLPQHRIEVLLMIASVERELAIDHEEQTQLQ